MSEKIVPNRATRALRLPVGQIPIALSAVETLPGRLSVTGLREIAIRMYETHKLAGDSTEVYNAASNLPADSQSTFHADWEFGGELDWDWEDHGYDASRDRVVSGIILEDG